MLRLKRLNEEISRITKKRSLVQHRGELNDYYFFPDKNDFTVWYNMIYVENGSPYDFCFYVFTYRFGETYPWHPPKCVFHSMTNNRIHPNLKPCGSCCLSILGTWGECSYSPVMGLEQIMMSFLGMVFVDNALRCEPGYEKLDNRHKIYEKIARFLSLKYHTEKISECIPADIQEQMREIIDEKMFFNKEKIMKIVENGKDEILHGIYGDVKVDYTELKKYYEEYYERLEKRLEKKIEDALD